VLLVYVAAALAPDAVAPQRVFDLTQISLRDAFLPPAWLEGAAASSSARTTRAEMSSQPSSTACGCRCSSASPRWHWPSPSACRSAHRGLRGGLIDSAIMRIADVQLTFPAILVAVLIDGAARAALGSGAHDRSRSGS
jgi:peptide/nickel transport system permease protein